MASSAGRSWACQMSASTSFMAQRPHAFRLATYAMTQPSRPTAEWVEPGVAYGLAEPGRT